MSIVATLTEAENRHMPSAHAFASIPLNKLVPWDGNVRKTNSTEGPAELTANIGVHGVLQSLVVTTAPSAFSETLEEAWTRAYQSNL